MDINLCVGFSHVVRSSGVNLMQVRKLARNLFIFPRMLLRAKLHKFVGIFLATFTQFDCWNMKKLIFFLDSAVCVRAYVCVYVCVCYLLLFAVQQTRERWCGLSCSYFEHTCYELYWLNAYAHIYTTNRNCTNTFRKLSLYIITFFFRFVFHSFVHSSQNGK